MAELKPCPFCGGEAVRWHTTPDGRYNSIVTERICGINTTHYKVECKRCGCKTKVYATNKGCFNAWNRRAEDGKRKEV